MDLDDNIHDVAEVAVPVPLHTLFSYRVSADILPNVQLGSRVLVPFGARKVPGIVVNLKPFDAQAFARPLKKVIGLLDDKPVFDLQMLDFLQRAARYYLYPLGEVLRTAAPALPREALKGLKTQGLIAQTKDIRGAKVSQKKRSKDPFFITPVEPDTPKILTPAQARAVGHIASQLDVSSTSSSAFLLHGVTGSGKTEVYLQVIAKARALGLGALVLVPEIALTPQLVHRFRARFGDDIAILHSGLTDRERYRFWGALRSGELHLAVGARSALFAPLEKLGVIVVDEEHDPSFKQEEGFRYNARDMALLRAKIAGAVCVLGSATPSLESVYLGHVHKLEILQLPERATAHALPKVDIINLAQNTQTPSGNPLISAPLHRALETCLGRGEQAILFLNRRGFSGSLRCESCQHVANCPACSIALTEHRREKLLRCHYCDYRRPHDAPCTSCGANAFVPIGSGTERIEDVLIPLFPTARIGRLDRDTAGGKQMEILLDKMAKHELDILVGTQMVTKGHDLPMVSLVGVLSADQSLIFPDFRASERTFQLLTQVAGRAGRGDTPGRVILQTYQPHHAAVQAAAAHDYAGFIKSELPSRKDLNYPPFSRLVAIRIDAGDLVVARDAAFELARTAMGHPCVQALEVDVLGPAPAPIERLRGRFRFRLLIRGRSRGQVFAVTQKLAERMEQGLGKARASIDVDPVSML